MILINKWEKTESEVVSGWQGERERESERKSQRERARRE